MKRFFTILLIIIICISSFPKVSSAINSNNNNTFKIAIIDVTDKDVAKYGRFPWSRDIHAKALKKLNVYGAKGVLFDFIFSEPDARWPERDSFFSNAIKESKIPVFIPYMFLKEGGAEAFSYKVDRMRVDDASHIKKVSQVLPALSQFAVNATNTGYINVYPDKDYVLKSVPVVLQWHDKFYPFIGINIAAYYKKVPIYEIYLKNKMLHVGSSKFRLNKDASLELDFGKPFTKYIHLSYSDLFEEDLTNQIKDKFIIMSFNASGLSDFFVTKSSNRFPGSEVHAVFLDFFFNR
ncbi:MAG: CHASE2 domain-containing protein [Deltaproteobacteria bacterium]|nr:CHASE2 domain-containing protein [Deltaproteobacteria bacterium]